MIRCSRYAGVPKFTIACITDHVCTCPRWGHQGVRSAIAVPGESGQGGYTYPAVRRGETGLGVR
jgi:hypothetical protein